MKIVFFGTANVALPILEELNKDHEILAVVTNPDAEVGRKKEMTETPVSALATDLKMKMFKPEKINGNTEFIEELRRLNADVFVVVAFGTIMPDEVVNMPPLKSVNVHFSVLPKYRGPSPIQAALMNGDRQTGTSIFILNQNVDSGPLLAQKIVDVAPDDNYFTLSDKLAKISAHLLLDTLEDYRNNKIAPLPQDESQASYTKIITKEDGKIDWNKSAAEIYNQFRAFYIWPGVWTIWNGQILKITDCLPGEQSTSSVPGTILDGGLVTCGQNSVLQINSLQLAGKNEAGIMDFLNGYREFVGSTLE